MIFAEIQIFSRILAENDKNDENIAEIVIISRKIKNGGGNSPPPRSALLDDLPR